MKQRQTESPPGPPKLLRPHELRAIRKELGWTQQEMAIALGLDNDRGNARITVGTWEAGRIPISGPVSLAVERLLDTQCKRIQPARRGK